MATSGVILPLIGPVPTAGPSNAVGPPSITSVTPGSGFPGDIIVITGVGLTGTTVVEFGTIEAGDFITIVSTVLMSINGDTQIVVVIPPTNFPANWLQIAGLYPAGARIQFNLTVFVGWDATACLLFASDDTFTQCPVAPNFQGKGNSSAGVQITGPAGLIATSASGAPGQGACVNPIYAQSTGQVYWEITWNTTTSASSSVGAGIFSVTAISNYRQFALDGTGGAIYHLDGNFWFQGVEAILNPLPVQKAGDTVGFLVDFNQVGGPVVNIFYWGPSSSLLSTASQITANRGPPGPWVPCIAFDTAGTNNFQATANFGVGGKSSFVGPKIQPSTFSDFPNLIYGWPG